MRRPLSVRRTDGVANDHAHPHNDVDADSDEYSQPERVLSVQQSVRLAVGRRFMRHGMHNDVQCQLRAGCMPRQYPNTDSDADAASHRDAD